MLFSKIPAILIDSENVGSTWTSLLDKNEKFELYICVTENAKSLNFSLLKQLTDEHKYKINIIECKPGKNSLDFYLSSYLGYLIGKNRHSSYIVVSQDNGYDNAIEYWQKEGYDVKRINTKPEKVKKVKVNRKTNNKPKVNDKVVENKNSETRVIVKDQNKVVKDKKENNKKKVVKKEGPKQSSSYDFLKSLLTDYSDEEIQDVKKCLDKVPSEKRTDKNNIYRRLIVKMNRTRGLAIYTLIKKKLDKYYGLLEKETSK